MKRKDVPRFKFALKNEENYFHWHLYVETYKLSNLSIESMHKADTVSYNGTVYGFITKYDLQCPDFGFKCYAIRESAYPKWA